MELRVCTTVLLLALASCTGSIQGGATSPGNGGGGNPGGAGAPGRVTGAAGDPAAAADLEVKAACAQRVLPTQPLRRLSDEQYRNVITDLFGASLAAPLLAGSLFPPTVIKGGFAADANANVVNTAQSNAVEDEAERIATTILASPDKYLRALLPCTLPATVTDAAIDTCVNAFIAKFGQRAYRRPLTTSETALARRVYDLIRPTQGAVAGWVSVVQYFMQAPALLYRVERGAGPSPDVPGLLRLTDHEMATRLSFLFLNGAPDSALLDAAAAGALATSAQVSAQARRLMQEPRFLAAMGAFHRDWLRLYELAEMTKDTAIFPDFTPAVEASLLEENTRLGQAVLADPAASIASLLVAKEVPVNATLAAYYGVTAPGATDTAWVSAAVPHRSGLLTSGALMAALSKVNRSNPIHRGAFIRTGIMCDTLPGLPANVDTAGPLQDTAGLPTARQRLAPLTTRADCKACHLQINPSGLALENYDGAGKWRDQEGGTTIDASGALDVGKGPVTFSTPAEFLSLLAGSDKVRDCYGLQWLRAALGRLEAPEDACSIATLKSAVVKSGGDLRALLVALTQTDAFLYRRTVEP
jgi:Protein of unknown function (DUF1592)/Protein of unknown function (DUF1588)/Protein of unknown function (DUF1595)/Protein of unknown function (DUF1585)/Protein of unknown function (DUF1587)